MGSREPKVDWRRRHALQLAGQLPEDPADALVVLDHMRELVEFMARGDQRERTLAVVVPSPSSASASRRAKS